VTQVTPTPTRPARLKRWFPADDSHLRKGIAGAAMQTVSNLIKPEALPLHCTSRKQDAALAFSLCASRVIVMCDSPSASSSLRIDGKRLSNTPVPRAESVLRAEIRAPLHSPEREPSPSTGKSNRPQRPRCPFVHPDCVSVTKEKPPRHRAASILCFRTDQCVTSSSERPRCS
jgi:hypothetical protein